MRADYLKFALANEIFAIQPSIMQKAVEYLENNAPNALALEQVANDSVTYEEKDNLAIISIEGAMYKKSMGGLCMSVASYPDIIKSIDRAEANSAIQKILFYVDTPGGAVAGLDEVAERIFTSPKETITLYSNLGASAGIYAFTASDKVYAASKNTELGSIGTIVSAYVDKTNDDKKITVVSKNAPNKVFNWNEEGIQKLQSKLDQHEKYFFEAVERHTGFTQDRIISVFNAGDTIFAEKALEEGFINGIISLNELTNNLVGKAVPTSDNRNKPANTIKKEQSMAISKEDILASEEYLSLQASHKAEVDGLKVSHEDALAKAVSAEVEAKVNDFRSMAKEIFAMSFERGLDKEFSISLLDTKSLVEAKAKLVDNMSSVGAIAAKETEVIVEQTQKNKLNERCQALGVTFIGKGE